jgi:hypothetical protein
VPSGALSSIETTWHGAHIRRAHEKDPLVLDQRLVRKGAHPLALASTRAAENSVDLAAGEPNPFNQAAPGNPNINHD